MLIFELKFFQWSRIGGEPLAKLASLPPLLLTPITTSRITEGAGEMRAKHFLLSVGLFAVLPSCTKDQPTPLRHVVVNQAFEHLLYIGLYVAKDAGFFERSGLDVTINTGGGDAQAFAALTSGEADFAQGDPAFVAIANEQGWEGRVIAMAVDRVAIWGVARDSSIIPFTDPTGFRGRRVATYPRPNTSFVVQQELAQRAGLRVGRDTRIVEVPFGSELAALQRGEVDIAQTIEPNVTQFERLGGRVVFSYPEAWGPLAFTGVMVAKSTIDRDPQLVRSFLEAYANAFALIHQNADSAVAIARRRLPTLDSSTVRTALNRLIMSGSIPRSIAVDSASWRKLLEIRLTVGDIRAMPSSLLYDNSFVNADSPVTP